MRKLLLPPPPWGRPFPWTGDLLHSSPSFWSGDVVFVLAMWICLLANRDSNAVAIPRRTFYMGLTALLLRGLHKFTRTHHTIHFAISCVLVPIAMTELEDSVFRHRAFAMYAVAWRVLLPHFVHNVSQCVVVGAIIFSIEVYATMLSFHKDNLEFPWRCPIVLFACMGFVYTQMQFLSAYKAIQQELAEEKTALESLVLMLCDSCIHLARDGDTIVRSTPQFDNLMGQTAGKTPLKSYLPSPAGECDRLRDAFERAQCGPVALPVTLLSKGGVSHQIDLFIVRQRSAAADGLQTDIGYLVGIREERSTLENSIDAPTFPQKDLAISWERCRNLEQTYCKEYADDVLQTASALDIPIAQPAEAEIASLHASSCAAFSAPTEILSPSCRKKDIERAEQACPLQECDGADCLPSTATVWVEGCAFPKSLDSILPGERILCYDNVGKGLVYAPVLTVGQTNQCSSGQGVTVTLADGAVLRMTSDHPVAVHTKGRCRKFSSQCMRASELQAGQDSLMMLKLSPVEVLSVETENEAEARNAGNSNEICWMNITMDQPRRHELLVASEACEEPGLRKHAIAVSSCDRTPDHNQMGLCIKNTFVSIVEEEEFQRVRAQSAPPTFARKERSDARKELKQHLLPNEDPPRLQARSPEHTEISSTSSKGLSSEISTPSDEGARAMVKVGAPVPHETSSMSFASACLSSFSHMQRCGIQNAGSAHSAQDPCMPCSFEFAHLRFPHRRAPCKASYLCEYCHDVSHNPSWRSSFRKNKAPLQVLPGAKFLQDQNLSKTWQEQNRLLLSN